MPTTIFLHLSWTTFRRMPMIGQTVAAFLKRFLPAEARRHDAQVIALGMVSDHVHLIARIGPSFDVPRLVQGLKGASARLANQDQTISRTGLRWAPGYYAASVSPQSLESAIRYVRRQTQRHPDLAIPERASFKTRRAAPSPDFSRG